MESSSGSVVMAPRGRENKFFDPPYHLREAAHAKKGEGGTRNRTASPIISMKLCIPALWIVLFNLLELARGFVAPGNLDSSSSSRANLHAENSAINECQDLGRRQFFASLVGAVSVMALSESASASTETLLESNNEEAFSATSISMASAASETVAKPTIDTRTIFDKAAKKALGGELIVS